MGHVVRRRVLAGMFMGLVVLWMALWCRPWCGSRAPVGELAPLVTLRASLAIVSRGTLRALGMGIVEEAKEGLEVGRWGAGWKGALKGVGDAADP